MNDMILAHHGVDGQEWGKRKYQYEDGSLTPLGRIHYGVGEAREKAKIKMREEKARAKNEIRIAKAKGKAEVAKIKAQAKAYKVKSEADSKAERDRIQADKEIESKRIEAEQEAERNISKENREIAKRDAKTQVELAEIANEGKEEKKTLTAGKVALAALATAGIGFLLYKAVSSDGKVSGVSDSAKTKGEDIVKDNKDKTVKDITKKTRDKVNYEFNEKGDYLKTKSRGKLFDALFGPVTSKTVTRSEANKKEQKKIQKEYASNQKKRAEEKAANKGKWKENAANAAKSAFDSILKRYRIKQSDDNEMILIHSADVCHWGILGMKWGVRRYQNEDGTLTELGKQHYGRALENARGSAAGSSKVLDTMTDNAVKSASNAIGNNAVNGILSGIAGGFTTGSLVGAAAGLGVATFLAITNKIRQHRAEKIQRILDENKQKVLTDFIENQSNNTEDYKEFKDSKEFRSIGGQYETEEEAFNAFKEHKKVAEDGAYNRIKEADLWTEEDVSKGTDKKRSREAADLGLKALNKIGRSGYDEKEGITNDDRSWFVYEDQTIGLATIADLVNRGKTKQEIKNLMTDADSVNFKNHYDNGVFQLSESGGYERLEPFIDACINIKKEESKK